MAPQCFFCTARARSRPRKGVGLSAGKSSTNRRLMAKSSNDCGRRLGNQAISVASASAADALGEGGKPGSLFPGIYAESLKQRSALLHFVLRQPRRREKIVQIRMEQRKSNG
jgi:hypothetical protein